MLKRPERSSPLLDNRTAPRIVESMALEDLTPIGSTDIDGARRLVGLPFESRRFPTVILGKTGTGKTTLLRSIAVSDMNVGRGLCVIDPHGDLVEDLLSAVPEFRRDDVTLLRPWDPSSAVGLNPVESTPSEWQGLAVAGLLDAFQKIFGDSWGPRSEHIFRHAALLLMDQENASFLALPRLFGDEEFRLFLLKNCRNRAVRVFWLTEFPGYPARLRAEAIAPLQNKLGLFLADPRLSHLFSAERSALRLRPIMDDGKILFVDLAKGRLGPGPAMIVGSLLLSRLALAAMTRLDQPALERRPFVVLVDEIHAFATPTFVSLLSETRKFGLAVTVALQYLGQLDRSLRSALLGSAGTIMSFRVGPEDAEVLRPFYGPEIPGDLLLNLPAYRAAVKAVVGRSVSQPMVVQTDSQPRPSHSGRSSDSATGFTR